MVSSIPSSPPIPECLSLRLVFLPSVMFAQCISVVKESDFLAGFQGCNVQADLNKKKQKSGCIMADKFLLLNASSVENGRNTKQCSRT